MAHGRHRPGPPFSIRNGQFVSGTSKPRSFISICFRLFIEVSSNQGRSLIPSVISQHHHVTCLLQRGEAPGRAHSCRHGGFNAEGNAHIHTIMATFHKWALNEEIVASTCFNPKRKFRVVCSQETATSRNACSLVLLWWFENTSPWWQWSPVGCRSLHLTTLTIHSIQSFETQYNFENANLLESPRLIYRTRLRVAGQFACVGCPVSNNHIQAKACKWPGVSSTRLESSCCIHTHTRLVFIFVICKKH